MHVSPARFPEPLPHQFAVWSRLQTPGPLAADQDSLVGMGADKVLGVRIDSDQFGAVDTLFHHAGNRIGSGAPAADHPDLGLELAQDLVKVFIILGNGRCCVHRLRECLFNN